MRYSQDAKGAYLTAAAEATDELEIARNAIECAQAGAAADIATVVENSARSGQQWASDLSASVEESGRLASAMLVSSEQRTMQTANEGAEACAELVQEQKAQVIPGRNKRGKRGRNSVAVNIASEGRRIEMQIA